MGAAPTPTPPTGPTRLPQRPIGGRISTGHVVTIVIGLVAAVLTYAVLRGGSSVDVAFASGELRPNEVITDKSFRFESIRLPAAARDRILTRSGATSVKGGRVLVHAAEGALITPSMVTGNPRGAMVSQGLPVEAVRPDLRVGDQVRVGVPGTKDDQIVLSDAAVVKCADVSKPFNQILYVDVPLADADRFFGRLTGKVAYQLFPRDPSTPPGAPVGPC